MLPWATLRTLLAYLLRPRINRKYRDSVLAQIGNNQTDDMLTFYQYQTPDFKRELRPFIPIKPWPVHVLQPLPFDGFVIQNRNQYELHRIVENEQRKCAKGNFTLIANAIKQLNFEDLKQMQQVFSSFLVYVGSLPNELIRANEKLFVGLCHSVFNRVELLIVLNSEIVQQRLLIGLAAYVWHCPIDVLKSASQYYPRLYELFCDAESDTRTVIVQICVAFEKATSQAIQDIPQVTKQHRFLISSLSSQYRVES
jgi:hypothetical protein